MSNMVQCDKCHEVMYSDNRSEKDAYAVVKIEYVDGYSHFHLCKSCYRQLRVEFMRNISAEDFYETFGDRE